MVTLIPSKRKNKAIYKVIGLTLFVSVFTASYVYLANNPKETAGRLAPADSSVVTVVETQNSTSLTVADADPASTVVTEGGGLDIFSSSGTGRKLAAFFATLEEVGPGAGLRYATALNKIKADPNSVSELINAYRGLETTAYGEQYKILFMLDQLKASQALPLATEVATSHLPSRIDPNDANAHGMSEYRSAVHVQMRAIGILSSIAKGGEPQANASLLRVINETPDLTVRGQAVMSYLNASTNFERDIAHVKSILPMDQQYLATTQTNIEKYVTPSIVAGIGK